MTTKARILVVEDEQDIRRLVAYNLKKHGYAVDEAADGEEALRLLRASAYGLIVLDLMLPGLSGTEVLGILKRDPRTAAMPVIMLTARSEEEDKVGGLNAGADDYMTKPFSVKELLARVGALLRRPAAWSGVTERLVGGGVVLDIERRKVTADGAPLDLSATEFNLLRFLMERRGRVVSRDQILDAVWKGDAFVEPRTVDVHIRRLRAELEKADAGRYIETVRGVGYRFSEED